MKKNKEQLDEVTRALIAAMTNDADTPQLQMTQDAAYPCIDI